MCLRLVRPCALDSRSCSSISCMIELSLRFSGGMVLNVLSVDLERCQKNGGLVFGVMFWLCSCVLALD